MKKIIILVVMLFPAMMYAQGIFDKIKQKTKSKAEQRLDRKIDKGIDKALDKTEEAAKKSTTPNPDKKAGDKNAAPAEQPVKEQPAVTEAPVKEAPPAADTSFKSYSRFDFVPGAEVVYAESFDQEAIGELPTGWNTTGSAEVVTLSNYPGKWLKLAQKSLYLTSNEKEFSENYTVEFDMIMHIKNNGHFFPYLSFGFFATNGESTTGNDFLRDYNRYSSLETIIYPAEFGHTKVGISSQKTRRQYFRADDKNVGSFEKCYGKPVHIAIWVQKERCRVWLNEEKLFDLPKAIPADYIMNQLQFQVHPASYREDEYGMYISNLKVAKGAPDTRHKLVDEGAFSTTGILFDVNSDVIKPASYGVLKEIAAILKENDGMRLKIVGHTDSDGNDAANLTLSQKRAAAVAKLLGSEFGIDIARLESEGKGETKPVADNKTKEGKAANRRVEFIKL